MNIEQYITSGIIESYAMGLASPGEVAQLEKLLPLHPELQEALSDFEYQLELFSVENEIPPPPGTREKIEARLRELPAIRKVRDKNGRYGRNRNDNRPKYIAVQVTSPYISVHKNWRIAFVVFCIMSKIFLALFIYYFVQYQHAQKDILRLEEQLGKNGQVILRPSSTNNQP